MKFILWSLVWWGILEIAAWRTCHYKGYDYYRGTVTAGTSLLVVLFWLVIGIWLESL